MITNYPFSVILDVPNNPYLASGGSTLKYMPFNKNNAEEAIIRELSNAALRIKSIYEQQKSAYENFNMLLPNGTTLEDIFKKQQNLFEETEVKPDFEIEELTNEQEKYVELLKKKQNDFHKNFLIAVNKIASATTIKELNSYKIRLNEDSDEISKLLQEALLTFKDKKIIEKLKKVRKNQSEDIKIRKDGKTLKISFGKNKKENKANNEIIAKKISEYYETLQRIAEYEKEHNLTHLGRNFAKSKVFRTQHEAMYKAYDTARSNFENALADYYNREGRRKIVRFMLSSIFGGTNDEELLIHSAKHGDYLVQASSFVFEQTSIKQIEREIALALSNSEKVRSFVLDVPTRIQVQKLPLAREKEQVHFELLTLKNNIDVKLEQFFRSWKVLDKVDNYVSIDFNEENKYILAFSNKLYHDLSRLTLAGGRGNNSLINEEVQDLSKTGTSLINSYDLFAQIGEVADTFFFTMLNSSSASGLNSAINKSSLESWLNSFIYEIAFNPTSFIQTVEGAIKENLNTQNIIYFFNAGSKIEPVYKILGNIYNFLLSTSNNIQSCITTKIQYDNSNGQELLNQADNLYPQIGPDGTINSSPKKYPAEAWDYVANQVAQNTLFMVHLDLLHLTDISTII